MENLKNMVICIQTFYYKSQYNSKRYNFQELRNGNFIDINAYFNEEICGREKNKRIYW